MGCSAVLGWMSMFFDGRGWRCSNKVKYIGEGKVGGLIHGCRGILFRLSFGMFACGASWIEIAHCQIEEVR
jgi:hypothetical protein